MVATSTLRWAGEGIPCQAVLLCLVRSWQSQLDVLQVLGTAAQGGDQFKSTNELRELSPPDCCTMKPKSLCICSKPWLSTLPKPWAGPGCEIPENQSPALSLDPFPREGMLFRWCRNFLHLSDASSWDPCESVAQPREPGSPSCVLQEPGSLQGVSQSLCFPLGLGKASPSTAPRWDTGVAVCPKGSSAFPGAGGTWGMQRGYTEMLHGKAAVWGGLARFWVPRDVTEVWGLGLILVQVSPPSLLQSCHLDVPGENSSPAENCTSIFLWLGMTFIPSMQFLLPKEDLNLTVYTSGTV